MREGVRFVDFKAFEAAIQYCDLSGHTKFNTRYQKSDSSRNIVCSRAGCPFRVYAVLSGNKKYFIDAVALHHRVTVSYQAAHKAKKTILGNGLQQQGNQFRLLPAYLDAVRTSDPQAVVHSTI